MKEKTVFDIFKKSFPMIPWNKTCYDYSLSSPISLDDIPQLTLKIQFVDGKRNKCFSMTIPIEEIQNKGKQNK